MQNSPPSRTNDRAKKRIENESSEINEGWEQQINSEKENEGEEDGNAEERQRLLQAKFIKDPERRLYYYVERK